MSEVILKGIGPDGKEVALRCNADGTLMGPSSGPPVAAPPRQALGYQQIPLADGQAHGLTVPDGADTALIVPEGRAVRWRDDGVPVTATAGMLFPEVINTSGGWQGAPYTGDLSKLSFIQANVGSGVAILNVAYYKG